MSEPTTLIDDVSIELAVVLGSTSMPVHQLLRMGRGAVIALDASESDSVQLLANNVQVAEGQILVEGEKISLAITRMLTLNDR
jgi:flagellar motor switch protein FliN